MIIVLIKYGHEDDKNTAWFPKIVTVFGLWLAFASILILPFDIAASKGSGSGIRVDVLWLIVYIMLAILVVAVIPFAFFYYESDQDSEAEEAADCCNTQAGQAIKWTGISIGIFLLLLFILYTFLGTADVPVYRIAQSRALVFPITQPLVTNQKDKCRYLKGNENPNTKESVACYGKAFRWLIPVSYPLYVVALLAFIG